MYGIPVDELSLSRIEGFRQAAQAAGLNMARSLRIATSMDSLVWRDAFPATDLGQPAGSGYTNEVYITGAIAANTWTLVFDTAAVPQLPNNRLLVIYKIFDLTVNPQVEAVRFRKGNTGATTLSLVRVGEIIGAKLTPELYLSEPVVYAPQDFPFIECYTRGAVPAAGERLAFGAYIAEPTGGNVS